jgi:hypothetical protein
MLYVLDSHHRPTGPLALHIHEDEGSGTPRPTTTTVLATLGWPRLALLKPA